MKIGAPTLKGAKILGVKNFFSPPPPSKLNSQKVAISTYVGKRPVPLPHAKFYENRYFVSREIFENVWWEIAGISHRYFLEHGVVFDTPSHSAWSESWGDVTPTGSVPRNGTLSIADGTTRARRRRNRNQKVHSDDAGYVENFALPHAQIWGLTPNF